ncbi:MAG: hypothetical protein V7K89_02645 [Nostoc sp.]|uniref:hypothetical protein n=1 Tax=Nostoc sp. TaxID=1180 RepID=UPI002FF512B2
MLHLSLLAAESEVRELELIARSIASMAALRKVALHKKFGSGKYLTLAEAIAQEKPLTLENINTMVDFFEKFKPDMDDLGWYVGTNNISKGLKYTLMSCP